MIRPAEVLADIVTELVAHVRTEETIDWWPTREGLHRLAEVGAYAGDAANDHIGKPEHRRWTTSSAGLLDQLAEACGVNDPTATDRTGAPAATPAAGRGRGGDGPMGASKPDSQAPPGGALLETLVDLEAAIADARRKTRTLLALPAPKAAPTPVALRELVGLIGDLTPDRAAALLAEARSWARTARVALTYDVALVTLTGVTCPTCGAGPLRVNVDASSDVRCHAYIAGPTEDGARFPMRCGETWPRQTWAQLLDHTTARTA